MKLRILNHTSVEAVHTHTRNSIECIKGLKSLCLSYPKDRL